MSPAIPVGRQLPYRERGGATCKYLSHGEQPCLRGKKSQGSPDGSFSLTTSTKMVSAFFRGEPLGYPWEGG